MPPQELARKAAKLRTLAQAEEKQVQMNG